MCVCPRLLEVPRERGEDDELRHEDAQHARHAHVGVVHVAPSQPALAPVLPAEGEGGHLVQDAVNAEAGDELEYGHERPAAVDEGLHDVAGDDAAEQDPKVGGGEPGAAGLEEAGHQEALAHHGVDGGQVEQDLEGVARLAEEVEANRRSERHHCQAVHEPHQRPPQVHDDPAGD